LCAAKGKFDFHAYLKGSVGKFTSSSSVWVR